jgi:hypothetical protein
MNDLRFFFPSLLALAIAGCGNGVETGPGGSGGTACEACAAPWSQVLGGTEWSTVRDVVSDAEGNVVLFASLSGKVDGLDLEAGDFQQNVVAKLDPAGDVIWTKALPDAAFARLSLDAAGHVFLAGSTDNALLDLGGGSLGKGKGNENLVFLAELDAAGEHVWSRAVASSPPDPEGNGYVLPLEIDLGPDGTLVVTGSYNGTLDFGSGDLAMPQNPLAVDTFVASFDRSGHQRWSRRFGSQPDGNTTAADTSMFLEDAAVGADGSIWLTGSLYGTLHEGGEVLTPSGLSDVLLARLDAGGDSVFTRIFGGADGDSGFGLALQADGGAVFTGLVVGTVDFGHGPTVAESFVSTPFVAAVDANGALRWDSRLPLLGLTGVYGTHVAIDPQGQVVALLGSGQPNVSIVTLDAISGSELGAASFEATTSDGTEPQLLFAAFNLDPAGNVLAGGALHGSTSLGTGPLTSEALQWGTSAFVARIAQ